MNLTEKVRVLTGGQRVKVRKKRKKKEEKIHFHVYDCVKYGFQLSTCDETLPVSYGSNKVEYKMEILTFQMLTSPLTS